MGFAKPIEKVEPILDYLISESQQKPSTMMEKLTDALKKVQDFIKKFSLQALFSSVMEAGRRCRMFISNITKGIVPCFQQRNAKPTAANLTDVEAAPTASSDEISSKLQVSAR